MKKTVSLLLAMVIVAVLCSVMVLPASAETPIEVNKLTITATDLKLANDNMSEADAIAACSAKMGSEVATRAIYSKTADGKYNYLSCFANTGWYKGGTGTLDEITAGAGIYGVMFVGTFKDECKPVDGVTEVKAAGAETSTFNFGTQNYHVCTQNELGYVQNYMNKKYAGVGNIVCLELFYNEEAKEIQVMQFEKIDANMDCRATACYSKTFAEYIETQSTYAYQSAQYVVAKVTSFDMLDGKNQSIDLSKVEYASFRSEGDFSSFVGFMLDGKYVDSKNYTAKAGSTIVEVKKDYLNTLSNGKHTVAIVSIEGLATTEFTLSGANASSTSTSEKASPKTGESGNTALLVILMAISFIGAAAIVRERKIAE